MESKDIIKIIDDYAAQSGLKPSTICQYALRTHRLYDRLKAGGECLPSTAKKLIAWVKANPPKQHLSREAS